MGTLSAMKYSSELFLTLADHTYVQCGTAGRAWSCWGGKTGGTEFRSGVGSTRRAGAIAEPDEKANISCYLINGVCHQAANRILLPAGITVRGARGYGVSSALYGTYGLPGMWLCSAPFAQHPGVTGDLPECIPAPDGLDADEHDESYARFLQQELRMLGEVEDRLQSNGLEPSELVSFSVQLFRHMAEFRLGDEFGEDLERRLLAIRRQSELDRLPPNELFTSQKTSPRDFAAAIDRVTVRFQDRMAEALSADQYQKLFDLSPDERVTLADPDIVARLRE